MSETTQPTPTTRKWPAWVVTVERDAEDGSVLASGAARTVTITDAASADPTDTLTLTVAPERWVSAGGAAEPAIVAVQLTSPAWPVAVRDYLPADARRVGAALIEAADQIEGTERRAPATATSTTGTAPLTFTPCGAGLVRIDAEDGSSQVYSTADLIAALGGAR